MAPRQRACPLWGNPTVFSSCIAHVGWLHFIPKVRLLVTDADALCAIASEMRSCGCTEHQSIWSRSYEGYCFWRWGMLAAVP